MNYLIGDVQGCCDALERLLAEIGFSPSRDRIHVLGDLVNRGPQSLATLRRLRGFGDSAVCLLGNHDLHLLAVAFGGRKPQRSDTLSDVLDAPDRDEWIEWLRHRPMAVVAHRWLLVHAGVLPQWDVATTLKLAQEVEAVLRSPDVGRFLSVMYGNEPVQWSPELSGTERLRLIINVLTRIRFCTADGTLDLATKERPQADDVRRPPPEGDEETSGGRAFPQAAGAAPPGFFPWFDAPGRRTAGTPVAFGHWSTLGLVNRPDLLALDTGCVWGGQLTAVRITGKEREVVQVRCEQARPPG